MASGKTFKIGDFKIHFSRQGIATKNGDGEVKRFYFPWGGGSDGRDSARGRDEADEREYDYNDNYKDDDRYDDRYAGDDGRDQDGYYEADEDAVDDDYQGGNENSWLIWLLLIVLPPIGIWMLWSKNKYELAARSAISAASTIWCIVLLVWLISGIGSGGGGSDNLTANNNVVTPSQPALTFPTATPDASGSGSGRSDVTVTASPTAAALTTPSPTPLSAPQTAAPAANATLAPTVTDAPIYVWFTPNGTYYHTDKNCSDMQNATRDLLQEAKNNGKTACPVCYVLGATTAGDGTTTTGTADTTTYYATTNGSYYHANSTCTGMKNAKAIDVATAVSNGKTPCPECLGNVYYTDGGTYYHKTSDCGGMKNAKLGTITQAKAAGKGACPVCLGGEDLTAGYYYATADGTYYHTDQTCTGMKNATKVTQESAEAKGQRPCPKCVGKDDLTYYATANGTYYHVKSDCSGMKNATKVTLATAVGQNKTACPTCIGGTTNKVTVTATAKPTTVVNASAATYYSTTDGKYYHNRSDCSGMKNATVVDSAMIAARKQTPCPDCVGTSKTYYSTTDGLYYHTVNDCQGMKGATIVTLAMIKNRDQTACPVCAGGKTENTYYATGNGTYYHKNATCSGMKGATSYNDITVKALGKPACPICAGGTPVGGEDDNTTYFYATANGTYYHKLSDCSGMANATKMSETAAKASGKSACPYCAGGAIPAGETPYYATANGSYYHKVSDCQGMAGATKYTLAGAKNTGKLACPICAGGKELAEEKNGEYYATATGLYYHAKSDCSGMRNAAKTTKASAEARNQSPCPECLSTGTTTYYYATAGGKYYHLKANCQGMTGATKYTLSAVKTLGKPACPYCAGGVTDPTTDEPTTGDINVWCTLEGTKYHSERYCSGMKSAAQVKLSWALKMNYERCTVCDAPDAP